MKAANFPNTQWSLVARASENDEATQHAAVAAFLRAYSPALRRYLVEGRRLPSETADDILQDFIAEKILGRKLLKFANRERGRFRSFLIASLSNFVASHARRHSR